MRGADDLSLQPHGERDGERRSMLLHNGRPTGVALAGARLEAQYEAQGVRLVFTTQDAPFEEQLDIFLLGPDLAVLDRATLAGAYATGVFADPGPCGANCLLFRFFAGAPMRLTLHETARPRFPLLAAVTEAPGVSRRFGFTRRFTLALDA